MSRATRRKAKRRASQFLTPAEAGLKWGVCERTARNWCREGRVPGAENRGTKRAKWLIPVGVFPRAPQADASEYAEIGVG